MKITLIVVGKTSEEYLVTGINKYVERMKHYTNFQQQVIRTQRSQKSKDIGRLKSEEGKEIIKRLPQNDYIILLDEKGTDYDTLGFSKFLQKKMNQSVNLTFVIGGAFGFSDELYKRSDMMLSLSRMTYSHQMIRLFFVEQLYRSFTIIKGEKYHHK